jgi:hypothetical protein
MDGAQKHYSRLSYTIARNLRRQHFEEFFESIVYILLAESRFMRSPSCMSVNPLLLTLEWLDQSLWNLVCISWLLSQSQRRTAYYINPFHQSVYLYVYPSYRCKGTAPLSLSLHTVLGNGSVNMNPRQKIHATIQELLDVSLSVRYLSYERRVCGSVYPPILAR